MKIDPKTYIGFILKEMKVVYATEHRFCERRYRFDFAILKDPQGNERKVYIEYDGLVSAKSRHTTITGFSNDCEKLNLATLHGWVGLRYTVLNYKNVWADLQVLLKK